MPLVDLCNVSFGYRRLSVLRDISFRLEQGRSLAIVGRSGSGKSTLGAIISTLLRPDAGTFKIQGIDVQGLKGSRLAEFRRNTIGMVFQGSELIPTMTAVENTALPAMLNGATWDEAQKRALALLEELEITQPNSCAACLSGGESQRVGIARALINAPTLIVADEPTASLDGMTKEIVGDVLFSQCHARGAGLIVVSHDVSVARRADRVMRLVDGQLSLDLAEASA